MLCLPALIFQLFVAQPGSGKVLERISVSWRPGAPAYELSIEADQKGEASLIRIAVSGRADFTYVNDSGSLPFIRIQDLTVWNRDVLKYETKVTSEYFYLSSVLRGTRRSPVLLVFGQGFEDEPDRLIIIGLDESDYPVLLFHAELNVDAFVDLDGDGAPEIVGHESFAEGLGKCTTTYDPYSVYRIVLGGKPAVVYDRALSKRYNIEHYVWVEPHFSSKWKVDHCGRGYKLVPMKQ